MAPVQQRFSAHAFERGARPDFLVVLDEEVTSDVMNRVCNRAQNGCETAVWMQVAERKLRRAPNGTYRLSAREGLHGECKELRSELLPCGIRVSDDGHFSHELTERPDTNFLILCRDDPAMDETAFRQALPEPYKSFTASRHAGGP